MAKQSNWRLEDLHELEQYGLAADLESTNITGLGQSQDFEAFNMSEVLSNLLTDDPSGLTSDNTLPFSTGLNSSLLPQLEDVTLQESFSFVLRAPTAHGFRHSQETITYVNRSQSYELQLQASNRGQSTDTLYKSTVTLSFCEIRLKNCEVDQFEQWSRDHPVERLLELDKVGCDGLSNLDNDEKKLNVISFIWSPFRNAILSLKVNCLSTEFAARKHGGERGVPLQLIVDTYSLNRNSGESELHIHQAACNIKVFKDKGGDRKQKQDQQKVEKLASCEQAKIQPSQSVTKLWSLPTSSTLLPNPPTLLLPTSPATPQSSRNSISGPSVASPYYLATPSPSSTNDNRLNDITMTSSMKETCDWLVANRFSPYVSLFANYAGQDLLRLSRKDLMDLCGVADGIRLYNALRPSVVRTVYICHEQEKFYQALCLQHLTIHELLDKIATKLSIQPEDVSTILKLTSSGILVLVDDTVMQNLRDDESFILHTIKEEGGKIQIVLKEHPLHVVSMQGATLRTNP